jgi:hypothetical protein
MKVITAIDEYRERKDENDVFCFLAGGITNCQEWQDLIISKLKNEDDNLIIFNPRRKKFPINDPTASFEQIKWEFDYLEQCDIFSMYFDSTEKSDQPICFYELGRNIERMKQRFSKDWINRILISVDTNFRRYPDVIIQTLLATDSKINPTTADNIELLTSLHANNISTSYKKYKKEIK